MIFFIEHIPVELEEDQYGLRLTAFNETLPLPRQSIAETKETLTKNFAVVTAKYTPTSDLLSAQELKEVSLKIVLYYFYLYNSWRGLYEKEKHRSLAFLEKDFTHPYTYDIVIDYFKNKYPKDYIGKCASMLGMVKEALLQFETNRKNFYNLLR